MEQLWFFIVNHWWLVLIFVVLLILTFQTEFSSHIQGIKLITPQEVIMFMNRGNLVIDIRSLDDYNNGHIVNSLSFPEEGIFTNIKLLQNKCSNKVLILICSNGQHAPKIGYALHKKYQLENIYSLKGGFNAWLLENLPIVKKEGLRDSRQQR